MARMADGELLLLIPIQEGVDVGELTYEMVPRVGDVEVALIVHREVGGYVQFLSGWDRGPAETSDPGHRRDHACLSIDAPHAVRQVVRHQRVALRVEDDRR